MRVSEGFDRKKERLAKEICMYVCRKVIMGKEEFKQEEERPRLSAFVH
jgi:hypothetical protein